MGLQYTRFSTAKLAVLTHWLVTHADPSRMENKGPAKNEYHRNESEWSSVTLLFDTKAEQETVIEHNFLLVQDGQDGNPTSFVFLSSTFTHLHCKLKFQNSLEWRGV